jgi:hypothetical protein
VGHVQLRKKWHRYKILVTKSEGKRPHRRLMHGWEDNIKMDLKEIGCEI